ncbi:MAG: hypothetical protein SGBAC_013528, partial [Bacillariaceae sp.]
NDQVSKRCFEVRPSTNGVGMFAVKPIAVGDVIIDSEQPIVSTTVSLFPTETVKAGDFRDRTEDANAEKEIDSIGAHTDIRNQDGMRGAIHHKEACYDRCYDRCMLKPPFCQTCGTPIGNLRQDHLKAPLHLELPGIEKGDVGLVFTPDKRNCEEGKVLASDESKLQEHEEGSHCKQKMSATSQTFWPPCCQHTAWCSKACWERGCDVHPWLCWNQKDRQLREHRKRLKSSDNLSNNGIRMANNSNESHPLIDPSSESSRRLQSFLEESENPKIFALAVHAVLLVLSLTQENPESRSENDDLKNHKTPASTPYNYLWWEDYGSHPLWWTLGEKDNQKDRFQSAQEFADCLGDWSKERISLMTGTEQQKGDEQDTGRRVGQRKRRRSQSESPCVVGLSEVTTSDQIKKEVDIASIFSVNNIGTLLGMLQCNVMEFSYPSPLEQYMEQAEQFMDEEHLESIASSAGFQAEDSNGHDLGDGTDQVDIGRQDELILGCQWLREKYWNTAKRDSASNSASVNQLDSPSEDNKENSFLEPPEPVVGSGLYPLLTLANHDCNPNASIEFLRESNLGSMIALRPIKPGEEICITYVPNGGRGAQLEAQSEDGQEKEESISVTSETVDNENCGDFFKHFEPTRTWKWLNPKQEGDSETDDDGGARGSEPLQRNSDGEELENVAEYIDEQSSDRCTEGEKSDDQSVASELEGGAKPGQRALALLEYGFICACTRCEYETKQQNRK